MKVQGLYFSPSGNTRKTLEKIIENIDYDKAESIDLTFPKLREQWDGVLEADLILVGVPVYYGTIPSLMLESLNKLKGIGKWAVPVAVYGLRSAEATVQELSGLLRNRGFKILAGANFVAEHSFSHNKAPIAKGRPHKGDLDIAADFGKKITEKMNTGLEEATIESKPLKAGENYSRKREEWPENATGKMVNVPSFDQEKCSQCQICVESCPTGAINSDTYAIEDYDCRRCFACVRVCSTEAWNINLPTPVIEFFTALDPNKTPVIFI